MLPSNTNSIAHLRKYPKSLKFLSWMAYYQYPYTTLYHKGVDLIFRFNVRQLNLIHRRMTHPSHVRALSNTEH
ncbi:MAG: hypothetical protein ACTSYZ_03245 [Candidatus Helarchaeota archaeon]